MEKVTLAITLNDGQTIHAELRPEDERRFTEQFGDGSTVQLTATDDDLQGHAFAGNVLVNVLDHSIPLRLPNAADAAALQRSAGDRRLDGDTCRRPGNLCGADIDVGSDWHRPIRERPHLERPRDGGDGAARRNGARASRVPVKGPARCQQPRGSRAGVEPSRPKWPREAAFAGTQATAGESAQEAAQVTTQSVLLDVDNPAVPAQALRAEQAEMAREGQAAGAQAASQAITRACLPMLTIRRSRTRQSAPERSKDISTKSPAALPPAICVARETISG